MFTGFCWSSYLMYKENWGCNGWSFGVSQFKISVIVCIVSFCCYWWSVVCSYWIALVSSQILALFKLINKCYLALLVSILIFYDKILKSCPCFVTHYWSIVLDFSTVYWFSSWSVISLLLLFWCNALLFQRNVLPPLKCQF